MSAEELAAASEPVVIGSLASRIQQRWPVARESDWLGTGGFKTFLRGVVDEEVRISLSPPGFVYDPRRHKAPNHLSELSEPMRDLVQRLYVVVGLPRLHPRQYQMLFNVSAEQSGQQRSLSETTKTARDRAVELGTPIARQPFGFVTKALFSRDALSETPRSARRRSLGGSETMCRSGPWVHSSISRVTICGC